MFSTTPAHIHSYQKNARACFLSAIYVSNAFRTSKEIGSLTDLRCSYALIFCLLGNSQSTKKIFQRV